MGDGFNCGTEDCDSPDIDEVTCPCGHGYFDNDGRFIPGAQVRSGRALSREDYRAHRRSCNTCDTRPENCSLRQQRPAASPPSPSQSVGKQSGPLPPIQANPEPVANNDDYAEYFLPKNHIDPRVAEAYVKVNGGTRASLKEKRFRDKDGFLIRANIYLSTEMIQEMQELTIRHQRGERLTELSLKTKTRRHAAQQERPRERTRNEGTDVDELAGGMERVNRSRTSEDARHAPRYDTKPRILPQSTPAVISTSASRSEPPYHAARPSNYSYTSSSIAQVETRRPTTTHELQDDLEEAGTGPRRHPKHPQKDLVPEEMYRRRR